MASIVRYSAPHSGTIPQSLKTIERTTSRETTTSLEEAATIVWTVVDGFYEAYPAATVSVTVREEMWVRANDAFAHAPIRFTASQFRRNRRPDRGCADKSLQESV